MISRVRPAWSKTAPPEGFRGVYINLDRVTDRRRSVERQLARLGLGDAYLRFAAIDGRTLKEDGRLNPGVVGCFRSHRGGDGVGTRRAKPRPLRRG